MDTVFDENGGVLFTGTTDETMKWLFENNQVRKNLECRVRMSKTPLYLIGIWEYLYIYN